MTCIGKFSSLLLSLSKASDIKQETVQSMMQQYYEIPVILYKECNIHHQEHPSKIYISVVPTDAQTEINNLSYVQ